MKRKFWITHIAGIVLCSLLVLGMAPVMAEPAGKEIHVLLVYNPANLKQSPNIMDAYESVLQEEGVPCKSMDVFRLIALNPEDVAKNVPALIFPDAVLQTVPAQFAEWTRKYLASGGNEALIYDPGIKDGNGNYLNKAAFADAAGLNYITYGSKGAESYTSGNVQFVSSGAREFFQIPLGKTINQTIAGYGYGELTYPFARVDSSAALQEKSIYAHGLTKNGEKIPLIVLGDFAKGKVLYANLPLGYLKGNGDDLLLRSILRTFLFDVVQIPHVMNVAKGIGGLVINWHVDSLVEWDTLPVMKKQGYLRKGINASIHITAGDFLDKPGDDEGFEACAAGNSLTRMLNEYGTIGSHGGWAHNWFAESIKNGTFKEKEIEEYIDKNNKCLEAVIGKKIIEYSAPMGVHPQPTATKVLEKLGILAYYSTGDMGSAPNRAFSAGKKVTDNVIEFPLMPFGRYASLYEEHSFGKKTDAEITEFFVSTLEYAARNRTVRTVYSHPRDIGYYMEPVKKFMDQAEQMQNRNILRVQPMSEIAAFILRLLKTSYSFRDSNSELSVSLQNPENLNEITVAIPKKSYGKPALDAKYIQEDEKYYYATVSEANANEKTILAPRR